MNPLQRATERLTSPVEVRGPLPAPPEAVWAVLADPRTYPDWLVGAQHIRAVDDGFPAPGTRFHHSVGPVEEATIDDVSESIAAEPPHRLLLDVHVGRTEGLVELLVQPQGDGSFLTFREKPRGHLSVATPALRPALFARNAVSLRRLRAYLGDGSRP
ncbi:SRPBCC family protein [Actinomarinicola tropica]|uniref:SRPBCC family protein n=1 Tax=Actinomarinicola tropica TaxID=2789776 RepID=UPI001899EE4C|nr:SRPBCC family protein [Actinomarinicola tropica]